MNQFGSEATTVYFDGECPLCSREIGFYQLQEGACSINWVDVTKVNLKDYPHGLTKEKALARFHVITVKGKLVSGGEAFSSLWLSLPRFNLVGQLFKVRPFALTLEIVYKIFLFCRPLLQRLLCQTFRPSNSNSKT